MSKWTKYLVKSSDGEAQSGSIYRRLLPSLTRRPGGRGKAEPAVVRFLEEWKEYFDGVTKRQATSFAKHLEIVRIKSGNYLCKMDHMADCLYIVYKGELNTQLAIRHASKVQTLEVFSTHDLIGSMSFILEVPWGCNVVAVTDAIVLKLSREFYDKLKSQTYLRSLNRKLLQDRTGCIIKSFKKCSLLSHVPDEELANVADLFEATCVKQGSTLYHSGQTTDTFYFISTGEMLYSEMDESQKFEIEVARLGPGVTIGEKALVEEAPIREGNIIAVRDTILFGLPKPKFVAFGQMAPQVLKSLQRTLLDRSSAALVSKKIPFVESLPQQKLYLLSKLCVLRKYMPNQVILREGSEPEEKKFHIVSHGELSVSVGNKKIRTLREGDYFGEMSVFGTEPITATVAVSSSTPATCLEFSKADFDSLFLSEPAVLAEIEIKVLGAKCHLSHVLNHPYARNMFVEHCAKEYAKENVNFWCEVGELKSLQRRLHLARTINKLKDVNGDKIEQEILKGRVNEIYSQFITEQAPEQINVSSAKTEETTRKFRAGEYSFDMFDSCRKEIYELMDKDSFPRFKMSQSFEKMLRLLGCYNNRDAREFPKLKATIEQTAREQKVFEVSSNGPAETSFP